MDKKIDGLGCCYIGKNRIKSGFYTEKERRCQKDKDVQDQDDIANLQKVTPAAHEQSSYFSSVQYSSAADRKTDPGSDEKTAEYGRQELVRRYIGERHKVKTKCKAK